MQAVYHYRASRIMNWLFNDRIYKRIISQTYTATVSTLEEVIADILTLEAPQNWTIGIYEGTIESTHSGGGDLGTWAGLYEMNVIWNGTYGVRGIITAQGYVFEASYNNSTWDVTRLMPAGGLTASKALVTNASGGITTSSTTNTELEYVHGVTSNIQTQLNSKIHYGMALANNTNIISVEGVGNGDYPLLWILELAKWQQTVTTGAIGLVRNNGADVSLASCVLVNKDNVVYNHYVNTNGKFTVQLTDNYSYVKLVILSI